MVSAFSVPKAKRQQKPLDNPGPGQYNPENSPKILKKSDPNYSFGKLERKYESIPVPGVGSYELKNTITNEKNPSYSMMSRRESVTDKINVGPGQYNPTINYGRQKAPSYSMKSRSNSVIDTVPGPGTYQPKVNAYSKISGIILRDLRASQVESKLQLGPGQYQIDKNYSKVLNSSPRYGFGKLQKFKNISSNYPGAGQGSDWLKGGGKYSVSKGARGHYNINNVPGPGSYQSNFNNPKKGKVTFSKDQKLKQIKHSVPGPGNYELKPFFADVPKYLLPNK